ncbi:MAG: transcription-repair coupling factor [Bacteroidota bacterium]
MSLRLLHQRLAETDPFDQLVSWATQLPAGTLSTLQVKGAAGSLPVFLLHHLHTKTETPLICLFPSDEEAAYFQSDLEQIAGEEGAPLRFPRTQHAPYNAEQVENVSALLDRAAVLQALANGFTGVVVTSVEALTEKVPPPDVVQQDTIPIALGQTIPPEDLVAQLIGLGFERVEFAEAPGELALRGGILDVFPFSGSYPIRIEFFGDEVDSLREFDARSQRSVSRLKETRLVPNLEREESADRPYTSFFDHLPERALLATFDEGGLLEQAQAQFDHATDQYAKHVETLEDPDEADVVPLPASRYLDAGALEVALLGYPRVLLGSFAATMAEASLTLDAQPQPNLGGNIKLLRERLRDLHTQGASTTILCDSRGQESRLRELLETELEHGYATLQLDSLHQGFELPWLGLAVYTDHQLFNRYHRPTARKQKRKTGGLSVRDLQHLSRGDFVVHVDYGIGKFMGMQKITVRDRQQEAVRVHFRGGDVLYVNVNALYKLHKYTGKEGHQPQLTKLGSGQWEKTKARTKKRVKDIARDLIKLYAKRRASDGYAFSGDTIWQRELEASFPFEDTPDQAVAAEAVKEDMEQPTPMDRLVCGDVGFGKTEVAVRAAFKAVQDGKQVAVLVPTTILAAQHHETFKQRMASFPVRVEMVSRFRTREEQKAVLADANAGKVDVLIGTHRIASKDVQFKNLGLLIIDEEQRFGVAVKERLRKMRVDVDTLTLTATPIPRTLQFSLMGARDLSIIATAPPNRQPIVTEIHTFSKDLIRDAIQYEVSRGGQVFFIHNRVKSIEEMADTIRLLLPEVRIRVAHGQMAGPQLEQVMHDFMERKFDVLVSTNIIESGLDISNANTIIINRADRFGLAELHQLRGRTGRSDRKAFCYLLVPSIHTLTREGKQRLQAIEEFSDLGSGFHIAMRDLDIRGAGNMLGAEQTGFIEDVGFETYHKLLDEAVQELRTEEFAEVFQDQKRPPRALESTVDVDADAFIPAGYVANNVERLNLYRRISEAETDAGLVEVRNELRDRFGALPDEVEALLTAARMRWHAQGLRLPKVIYKNERLFLDMPNQAEDPYFYEATFHPLLERLGGLDHRYVLRDKKSKRLRAIVQDVPTLEQAFDLLAQLDPTDPADAPSTDVTASSFAA